MIFTIKEIIDLALFSGVEISQKYLNHILNENLSMCPDYETEITVIEHDGKKSAYFTEYPEEGAISLG